MNVQRIASQIKKKKKKRRKMASKAVFVAAVLIALVASASAGKLAHGRHLGWINGMKGDRLRVLILVACVVSGEQEGSRSVIDGEEDIDECQLKEEHPCYGVCTNTPGSYTCQCPPGTSGDATIKNGCRPKDNFSLALKVVTGVSVGVFLPVFMCFWLYLFI